MLNPERTLQMIDAHTHMIDPAFAEDLDVVLEQAQLAGVHRIAVVGQDAAENEQVLALAKEQPCVLPFLGFHPQQFADDQPLPADGQLEEVCVQIEQRSGEITGIGEVGIDHWVCRTAERRLWQQEAFERLVKLAMRLDLPLNVHSRSCGKRTLELLLKWGAMRVLMHAFDGKAGHALRGAEAGYVFSVPASVVRSPQKQRMVRALPLHALALETDSPVLAPSAGMRNTPANVCIARDCLASLKGLDSKETADVTSQNIERLFALSHQ